MRTEPILQVSGWISSPMELLIPLNLKHFTNVRRPNTGKVMRMMTGSGIATLTIMEFGMTRKR